MKTILSSRRHHYVPIVSIFLIMSIMVALIAGMVGCVSPSQNLEIRTWYDLDAVRDNLSGHHRLMNDLDATTVPAMTSGRARQLMGERAGSRLEAMISHLAALSTGKDTRYVAYLSTAPGRVGVTSGFSVLLLREGSSRISEW